MATYFYSLIDYNQNWDWNSVDSYYQVLMLTISLNQTVKDTFKQELQNAINASTSSNLSNAALALYIEKLVNATLASVPAHCQQVQNLDSVEKILADF